MALDADPGVLAVAAQPMWLHWTDACSGRALRHALDYAATNVRTASRSTP